MQRDSVTIAVIAGIVAIVIADMIIQPTDGVQALITAIIGAVTGYLTHALGVQSGSTVAGNAVQQVVDNTKELAPLTHDPQS